MIGWAPPDSAVVSALAVPHPSALAVTRYRPGASARANCPAASVTPPGSPAAPAATDARAFDGAPIWSTTRPRTGNPSASVTVPTSRRSPGPSVASRAIG